jgi:hypothetical protein
MPTDECPEGAHPTFSADEHVKHQLIALQSFKKDLIES